MTTLDELKKLPCYGVALRKCADCEQIQLCNKLAVKFEKFYGVNSNMRANIRISAAMKTNAIGVFK